LLKSLKRLSTSLAWAHTIFLLRFSYNLHIKQLDPVCSWQRFSSFYRCFQLNGAFCVSAHISQMYCLSNSDPHQHSLFIKLSFYLSLPYSLRFLVRSNLWRLFCYRLCIRGTSKTKMERNQRCIARRILRASEKL